VTNLSQPKGRFGVWLRDVREAAGLSQADVARAIGCSDSAISVYECGKGAPRREFWQPMADLFDVEVEEVALAARGWREVAPTVVLPKLIDPGHVSCDESCLHFARCRVAVDIGLPPYCFDVTEDDVFAARQLGAVAVLMERAEQQEPGL
jgi:DNA-binding XRE family transcriptional regulator